MEQKPEIHKCYMYHSIQNGKYCCDDLFVKHFKKLAIIRSAAFNWCSKHRDLLNPKMVTVKEGMNDEELLQAALEDRPLIRPVYRFPVPIKDLFCMFVYYHQGSLTKHLPCDFLNFFQADQISLAYIYKLNICKEIELYRKYYDKHKAGMVFDIPKNYYSSIFIPRSYISFKYSCPEIYKEVFDKYDCRISGFGVEFIELENRDIGLDFDFMSDLMICRSKDDQYIFYFKYDSTQKVEEEEYHIPYEVSHATIAALK